MSTFQRETMLDLGDLGSHPAVIDGELTGREHIVCKIKKVEVYVFGEWRDVTAELSARARDAIEIEFREKYSEDHIASLSWVGRDTRFA